MTVAENFRTDALKSFRDYKQLAEKAVGQIDDEQFFVQIDPESNSVAAVVKHVAGNLHSRWRDFLTTDGEKPDRDRDSEFVVESDDRASLMEFWQSGWNVLFSVLTPLNDLDLERIVTIRGKEHTVVEAINRQLTHYAYHVGQIVLLAKHYQSDKWETLSVPKNRSRAFNEFLRSRPGSGRRAGLEDATSFAEHEKKGS
jgi:hypothetical protein